MLTGCFYRLRVGAVQSGEEKASEDLIAAFQYLTGCKKEGTDSLVGSVVTAQRRMISN